MSFDVVLVNPPIIDRRSIEIPTRSHNPFEHLGLGYICSYLRENNYTVNIIDSYINERSIRETVKLIEKDSPRLVGLSATHEFLTASVDVARCLREDGYDGVIVLGGYLPTFLHDKIMEHFEFFDAVVRGEGEFTLLDLMNKLGNRKEWGSVPGLTYRLDGAIIVNPSRDLIPDLDKLPHPSRDTLPDLARMYDYSAISSSRGCPMSCSFCSIHSFYGKSAGERWRARSPENIADEVEKLAKKHGVKQVAFTDDNFFGIPGKGNTRAVKIARALMAKSLGVEFSILCRVNDLDEGLLRLLRVSGLRSLFIGFESGIERALTTFNKKVTAAQNKKAIDLIKKIGIKCFPGFIMFDPYSTLEEVRENLAFAEYAEKDTDCIRIDDLLGSLQPFTGTAIRERLEKEGRIIYPDSPLLDMDVIPTYRIADLRVETLRTALKNIRNILLRPRFDELNLLRRKTISDPALSDRIEKTAVRFNNAVDRMRTFEKGFFREALEFIGKNPGIEPEESGKVEELAMREAGLINREIASVNTEVDSLAAEAKNA
ncbi:MAG: B12-binding domain-containing radical SAM protein [Firmicutes bacterium]|nr:B12-binding domain-containing radical SAM protein [Bacillota bacterium]